MGGRPAPERSAGPQGRRRSAPPRSQGWHAWSRRNGTSVPPRRLPATGGAFSANLCSGFLPSSSAFRGLRHDRRVDTHRFEHGVSSCPRCHRDNLFVIAWPFWYIRRWRARERRPEIALEVLNQRFALGEIGRSEYLQNRDDILAAQVR